MRFHAKIWLLLGFGFVTLRLQPADNPPAPAPHAASASAESIWADLAAGNRRFVAGHPAAREYLNLRQKLAEGQSPRVVVLSCSDSRVSPELVFDKNLGDLFVVRVAGNVTDPVVLGSMEYAAEHLGSTLVVVLGHSECGAVQAACSGKKMPTANLEAIGERIAPACSKASGKNATQLSVEANVRKSAKDLLANSHVLHELVESGKLTVIRAVYHLETGEVTRLD